MNTTLGNTKEEVGPVPGNQKTPAQRVRDRLRAKVEKRLAEARNELKKEANRLPEDRKS